MTQRLNVTAKNEKQCVLAIVHTVPPQTSGSEYLEAAHTEGEEYSILCVVR